MWFRRILIFASRYSQIITQLAVKLLLVMFISCMQVTPKSSEKEESKISQDEAKTEVGFVLDLLYIFGSLPLMLKFIILSWLASNFSFKF